METKFECPKCKGYKWRSSDWGKQGFCTNEDEVGNVCGFGWNRKADDHKYFKEPEHE